MQKYGKVALDVYRQAYIDAAKEQLRVLGYTDILPLGNNEPIDPVTASMYLTMAGGDPNKAAQAAQTRKWQASPENFGGQRQQGGQQQTGQTGQTQQTQQNNQQQAPVTGADFAKQFGGAVR